MSEQRLQHLIRFYSILDALEQHIGGAKKLVDGSGRMQWPNRGVYFFREAGEICLDTGGGPRIVRVGTHALKTGGSTKLWGRLSAHRGQRTPIRRAVAVVVVGVGAAAVFAGSGVQPVQIINGGYATVIESEARLLYNTLDSTPGKMPTHYLRPSRTRARSKVIGLN